MKNSAKEKLIELREKRLDELYFEEEYSTVSLESQFENGLISAEDYDRESKIRNLKEKGII